MYQRIKQSRALLEQQKGKKRAIENEIYQIEQKVRQLKRLENRHDRALTIVKQVGLQTQQQLEYRLSEQVSLALATVFNDPYELVVEFVERRGKTEADIYYKRRNLRVMPFGFVGGGAIDVGAFALRVAYLMMRQDTHIRPSLFLDEPFKGLKGHEANIRALKLLMNVSNNKKCPIQIITISDERIPREDIIEYSDRVFLVQNNSGVSKVIQL